MCFCVLRQSSRWPPKLAGKWSLPVKNFFEITVSLSVSEINVLSLFCAEIQNVRQKWRQKELLHNLVSRLCRYTEGKKNVIEITLSCSVSEINVFLSFTQKLTMTAKICGKNFGAKSQVVSAVSPWINCFIKCLHLHPLNASLHFIQKFKLVAKSSRKNFLGKVTIRLYSNPLGKKILWNRSILQCFRDNEFFCFTQKFKMAVKNAGKTGKVVIFRCRNPVGKKFLQNHSISLRIRKKWFLEKSPEDSADIFGS